MGLFSKNQFNVSHMTISNISDVLQYSFGLFYYTSGKNISNFKIFPNSNIHIFYLKKAYKIFNINNYGNFRTYILWNILVPDSFCEIDLFEKYILLCIPFMTDSDIDFLSIAILKINFFAYLHKKVLECIEVYVPC